MTNIKSLSLYHFGMLIKKQFKAENQTDSFLIYIMKEFKNGTESFV